MSLLFTAFFFRSSFILLSQWRAKNYQTMTTIHRIIHFVLRRWWWRWCKIYSVNVIHCTLRSFWNVNFHTHKKKNVSKFVILNELLYDKTRVVFVLTTIRLFHRSSSGCQKLHLQQPNTNFRGNSLHCWLRWWTTTIFCIGTGFSTKWTCQVWYTVSMPCALLLYILNRIPILIY